MLLRNTFELPALFRLCSDRLDSMLVSRVKRACDFFSGTFNSQVAQQAA